MALCLQYVQLKNFWKYKVAMSSDQEDHMVSFETTKGLLVVEEISDRYGEKLFLLPI